MHLLLQVGGQNVCSGTQNEQWRKVTRWAHACTHLESCACWYHQHKLRNALGLVGHDTCNHVCICFIHLFLCTGFARRVEHGHASDSSETGRVACPGYGAVLRGRRPLRPLERTSPLEIDSPTGRCRLLHARCFTMLMLFEKSISLGSTFFFFFFFTNYLYLLVHVSTRILFSDNRLLKTVSLRRIAFSNCNK